MTQWADPDLALWVMEQKKAESDSKQVFMGEIGWKSRVFSQQFGQGHWGHHGSNPSTVPNMSLVKRDFLSSCSCKEREGLWTTAHQGTCLMKVTLSVLWTWENCKLSIYKWSLLNPILHECWNACNTYKAESYWLRKTGLSFNGSYDSMCFKYTQRVAFKTLKQQIMWLIHLYSEAQ